MQKAIKNADFVEECLCDSTAIIQAIDVGTKLKKMNVVESSIAATLAIMNQFTVSSIQTFVKQSGIISYEGVFNMFNFRLLHFKAYISRYIKEFFSKHESEDFQREVESIYMLWIKKIETPIEIRTLLVWTTIGVLLFSLDI